MRRTKPKNEVEKLADPVEMSRHLSLDGLMRKMDIPEKLNHDGAFQMGRTVGYAIARIETARIQYGPLIEEYLLWCPEPYRDQVRDKAINRFAEIDRKDSAESDRAINRLARMVVEVRNIASRLGVKVPGPLDVKGHLPPPGLFTEREMIDAVGKS